MADKTSAEGLRAASARYNELLEAVREPLHEKGLGELFFELDAAVGHYVCEGMLSGARRALTMSELDDETLIGLLL